METFPIETERLILRRIEGTDAPFFFKLFNSPGWLQFIGDRNIKTFADAEEDIKEKYLPSFALYGYGSYVVLLKSTAVPIGCCGLYKRVSLDHPDIGFAFLSEYTAKGYAFEASKAILTHAQEILQLPKILAISDARNKASIRLLEKLGLTNCGNYRGDEASNLLLLFERNLTV